MHYFANFTTNPLTKRWLYEIGLERLKQFDPNLDPTEHFNKIIKAGRRTIHTEEPDKWLSLLNRRAKAYRKSQPTIPYQPSAQTQRMYLERMQEALRPPQPQKAPSGTINVPRGEYVKENGRRRRIGDKPVIYK